MSQHSHECYTDVFLTVHPKDGLQSVQEKQRQGHALDEELAQYFKERALIEDQYAKSLVKASKRLYVMDSAVLGGLTPIWELLLNELTEISNIHGVLAYRIMNEIDKELKTPASADIDKIKSLEPTFQQLSKDYETGLKSKKSGKSSLFKSTPKVHSDKLLSKWTSDGPALLQLYENVERARLQRLKALVETFEQINKEQLDQRTKIANATLSSTGTFDVDNDIRQYCKTKKNHLTPVIIPTTSTPSINTIEPSDPVSPKDSPRQNTEKKQRSRFSILRKSKKPSSSSLKKEPCSISSIPEHYEQQPDQPDYIDDVSEAVPNSSNLSPHSEQQEVEQVARNGSNRTQSPLLNNVPSTTTISSAVNQTPPVDAEGYSIPFPDTFGQSTSTEDAINLDEHSGLDSSPFGSQRLKFNIMDETTSENNQQLEQEKATLTRISSLLREQTPSTTTKRRGRRTNMRVQSNYWEAGPPSPLSSINEHGSSINVGSTISSTSSNDLATNPFRHSIAPNNHRSSPSPTSSQERIPSIGIHQSSSSSSSSVIHPTLIASIIETVNVTQNNGNAEITGQIQLSYDGPILRSDTILKVRLQHIQHIQPVHPLIHPSSTDDPTLFAIPLRILTEPTSLFTYHQSEIPAHNILPLVAEAAWKTSDTGTMLMVKYKLTDKMEPISDHGQLRIIVRPGPITKAQSTPEGIWDQQHQLFTWNAAEIIEQNPTRLLAKFIGTDRSDSPSLTLKYYCRDRLVSGIEVASWLEDQAMDVRTHQCITKSGTILLG